VITLDLPQGALEALENTAQAVASDPTLSARMFDRQQTLTLALVTRGREPLAPLPVMGWSQEFHGCLDLLSFLDRVPDLTKFWIQRGLRDPEVAQTFSDLGLWMRKYFAQTGFWGTQAQDWLVTHFTGGLVRLGRLQFQLDQQEAGSSGEVVVHVHIPEGEPLDPKACEAAFRRAEELFPLAFPDALPTAFVCDSWLLDPVLPELLRPESNIARFQQGFTISDIGGSDHQMRERVFGDPNADPLAAEAETHLQKAVQDAWREGRKFQNCRGIRPFRARRST